MNKSQQFHNTVMWMLVLGTIILILVAVMVSDKSIRNILLDVGIAMGLGALIEILIFKVNPKWFGPKSKNPDETD